MNRRFSERQTPTAARLGTAGTLAKVGFIAGLILIPAAIMGCAGQLDSSITPRDGTGGSGQVGTGGSNNAGTGGSGQTGTGGSSGMTCDAVKQVFMPSCASNGSCHQPVGVFPPKLDGTADLKTLTALTSTGPCAGKKIIEPADRANSVLITRVKGDSCGHQMPDMMLGIAGIQHLSQTDVDCLTSWVNAQ